VKQHIPKIQWLWIDTCCIDSKNNNEVSEAINSMFRWYSDAEVCLAYLPDVTCPGDHSNADVHEVIKPMLKTARWFQRGWTLQELLAPTVVIFLTEDWKVIGRKGKDCGRSGLAMETGPLLDSVIATITGLPEAVLQDHSKSRFFSVDDKLKWLGDRQTTREEDASYCMLGVTGVTMNIRYGEGRNATRARLLRKARRNEASTQHKHDDIEAPVIRCNIPLPRDVDHVQRVAFEKEMRLNLATSGACVALVGPSGIG
jgi:hypothetical protein